MFPSQQNLTRWSLLCGFQSHSGCGKALPGSADQNGQQRQPLASPPGQCGPTALPGLRVVEMGFPDRARHGVPGPAHCSPTR